MVLFIKDVWHIRKISRIISSMILSFSVNKDNPVNDYSGLTSIQNLIVNIIILKRS